MSNLDIWHKLEKTDPSQTKGFNRAGGFKGTAIKPIYTEQKMTEVFGPCGTGWGFTEPHFQTCPGSDGQLAVYCWLSLWYVHEGKRSELVPGVGGDMVVVKQSNGLRTDDEAFKKAFTDAISNAMKHIGMSADVHMGRFDDSKYVAERRREEAEAEETAPSAPSSFERHKAAISSATDLTALKNAFDAAKADKSISREEADDLVAAKDKRKLELMPPAANLGQHLDNLERQSATNPN